MEHGLRRCCVQRAAEEVKADLGDLIAIVHTLSTTKAENRGAKHGCSCTAQLAQCAIQAPLLDHLETIETTQMDPVPK